MNKTMLRFRVWDNEHKKFIKSYQEIGKYFHGFCNSEDERDIGLSFWEVPDGYFRILKSTGLKDKKGVEVFEGDIVKYKHLHGFKADDEDYLTRKDYEEEIGVIIFENGVFYPIPYYDSCDDGYYSWRTYDFEVIGNLMENPELIKEVNK